MLQRVLARENVDERRRALFQASGITTRRQLMQRSLWDVAHAVDMSELMEKLSIRLAPTSRTAFDLFLDSANHPMFLRTGLTNIDKALNGGLHCRGLSEFVGTAAIGKSQCAMTLAVMCAIDYPENSVMFFDVEHNFSAKRLLQITIARIRIGRADRDANINELAAQVMQRIRVVRVDSIAAFVAKLRDMENAMHLQAVKLVIVDCVTTLFMKAFVVVTNRASTLESEAGLYTKPLLGDNWAHCVTTRFILERHASNRVITIVKSSVAGYVVQPFTIKEGGVEPIDDPQLLREANEDDFSIHDELLSDLALGALPMVDPASTLRSTQQSNPEDPDATQLMERSDDESQHQEDEQLPERAAETESSTSFEIVSDSNEEEDESFYWEVTEE
ncbi:DNA repair protein RAD51 [Phytophthora boehmeriae]|uniref:DNA repair protein RAD51 n=1 Tax=Phytophthora boehmeriae TaxID=109152 RepID=A0A8T1XB27_9STRA|nr:DNA repair protein RAD51 [Phytophthora boehmeriae]